jgi:hypothetical protein
VVLPQGCLARETAGLTFKIMITHKGKFIRFGLECVAFNETDFLEATLRMFQPFIDKIVVLTGEKSWMGNVQNDGKVEEVVAPLVGKFSNIYLVNGDWKTEADQRNEGLKHLKECDYVFIVDADEMWPTGSIHKVQDYMLRHSSYTVFLGNWNTRFKNINWRVEPREAFRPAIAMNNKKGLKFLKNRHLELSPNVASTLIPEDVLLIDHFSYVRSEHQKIKEKLQTFSHANEIVNGVDWWYENMYLEADLKSRYLHPTNPECYQGLKEDPLHPEIRKFLKKYSPQFFKK